MVTFSLCCCWMSGTFTYTERQKFCNFIRIISHILELFLKCNETLAFHSATFVQVNSNFNFETDYKS